MTLGPLPSIRRHCVDCSGGSAKAVAYCQIHDCPLWVYRFGKRPANIRPVEFVDPSKMPDPSIPLENLPAVKITSDSGMSEEQRRKAAERLAAGREKRLATSSA
jgi:hypothetical protein